MTPFWVFLATHSGFPYEIVILGIVLALYFRKQLVKKESFLVVIKQIAIVIAAFSTFRLIGEFLKSGIALPRPCWDPAKPSLIPCPESLSFPSGHALGAIMLAVFISLISRIRVISLISLIIAILVAISRVIVGIHTWPDVIVGGLLGVAFGFLLFRFYWRK